MVSTLATYSLIVMVVYVGIMFYFGWKGYKKSSDSMQDYTLARGYLGPVSIGVAYSATFVSTIVFIGIPGWGYITGLSVLWHTFLFWGAAIVALIVMTKTFRRIGTRQGSLSMPEWIGHRYNSDVLKVIFGLLVFFNILYIGAQFVGLAIIFEYLIDLPFTYGVVGAVILVTAYTFLGGTYSDVMTDFVQGIIMAAIGVVVLASIFWVFGGFGGLVSGLEAQSPQLTAMTNPNFPFFAGAVPLLGVIFFGFTISFQPQLMNKYLTLEREHDIKVFIASATVSFFLFYFMLFTGPGARALNPGLENPDTAAMIYIGEAFPTVVVALIGAAFLSAAISTSDGLIVSVATAIGNDIYRSVIADVEGASDAELERIERRSVWITRVVIVLVGIVAGAFVILQPPAFLATLAASGTLVFVAAAFPPTFLGLFWDGGSEIGAVASAIVGPALMLLWLFGTLTLGIASLYVAGIYVVGVSTVVFVVVSLLTPTPDKLSLKSPS